MKISVIIPVYNIADYIERCLISLFMQTYREFEIILVDDCGQDNSMTVARECIKNARWEGTVKYVKHENNQGLSAARNSGIHASSGDYIFFLDGDDTLSEKCLEIMAQAVSEDDIDMVMAKYDYVFTSGETFNNIFPFHKMSCISDVTLVDLYRRRLLPWNAVNRLIKKDFIINNDLFFTVGITSEDLLWNFQTLLYLKKVSLLDEHTYHYYRNREGSIMDNAKCSLCSYGSDLLKVMELCDEILSKSLTSPQIIKYYLELRYEYVPYSILWHGCKNRKELIREILKKRISRFYKHLPLLKKLFFLCPSPVIQIWYSFKFILLEYKYIIKNKIFHIS